ncbi:MAG: hypothetical protein KDK36_17680, partial [Leptospiraceae bacterium]|nr:hypothetical protein [Leptospiraceae bacterium]
MSILLTIAIYLTSIEMFVNDFRDHKLSVAKFIASMIKGDIHSKFTNLESIQTHEFKEYYRIINRIYENEKYIRYIYTLYLNKEEEKLYYGVDASRLKNDTIWIESIDVSFSAFMKNDKLTIDFNYELRDSDFKVNIPNYGELKIRIQQSPAKAIFIGKEKILEVKNEKPFEVITKSGILNNENRVKEFSIPFFNSKEDFQLSFSQKGQPGSDPGSDFIDRPKQIEKIKNLIKFNSDFIDEEPTYKSYGSLLSAYSIIKDKDGSGVGVVIVDVESKEIDNFKHRFFTVVIVLSIIIFILTTILSLILAKYFTKPLEQLTTAVEKLSEGNFESKVEIKS